MAAYSFNEAGEIEIDFNGVKPSADIRTKMKSVNYRWNPNRMIWWALENNDTIAMAKAICDGGNIAEFKGQTYPSAISDEPIRAYVRKVPSADYALKVKIRDIVNASKAELENFERILKTYVNEVMTEDNAQHSGNAVSKSQESVWMNCFKFIASSLAELSADMQEFDLIFEYSLPGTVHERPDVFLLTNTKSISLEFKKKEAPQMDDNKDDVAQAIRYKEWLENHHQVTRDRAIIVKSYLVCTHKNAVAGSLRGIDVLTKDNFIAVINQELSGEKICTFSHEWLASSKTEMPDMLQAIERMYREGKIPYISDVNEKCLKTVLKHIDEAKTHHKKILILINGVPGAGKTAVGQSVVYEENKGGEAKAVYLSGNGPLVEVLQYQINQVGNNRHMGENAIQGMKEFKAAYFYSDRKTPQQTILIFDEAQRAWDPNKLGKDFSEPEGLFRVGERIFNENGYAVLIGLFGNGQFIYTGEEAGILLWKDALKKHSDWNVMVSGDLSDELEGLGERKLVENNMFLPVSLRADFIDCSKWVEQAINRKNVTLQHAKLELEKLQKTSMRICITRFFSKVQTRISEIDTDHPEWKYGILISNFAVQSVIRAALPGWDIGYNGRNVVSNGAYGAWFTGNCKKLDKACTVYGNQGLELDCPIVVFGGSYIRNNGTWITNGSNFDRQKSKYSDPDTIVENNFRVLLTRARKEIILLVPNDPLLDETYQYFLDMGVDVL